MNGPSIVVKCDRPEFGFDYIQFTKMAKSMEIMLLSSFGCEFVVVGGETFDFDECPEVKELHDGNGWNLEEVQIWICVFENEDVFFYDV